MKNAMVHRRIVELAKKLKEKRGVYVLVPDGVFYETVDDEILDVLIKNEKLRGVYVTLSREYAVIQKRMLDKKIDASKLYFIDGITKSRWKFYDTENCSFLSSPNSLTELSIAITEQLNKGIYDFLFFDSFSTLLISNDAKSTQKFAHYIISKLNDYKIAGLILLVSEDEESKKSISIVSQFCDGCVSFNSKQSSYDK